MIDLWPTDIENSDIELKAPVYILKQQASLLGKKTQNIVTAEVGKPIQSNIWVGRKSQIGAMDSPFTSLGFSDSVDNTIFFHSFYLVAPAFANYRYELFTIVNDIRLYPVIIYLDEDVLAEIAPSAEKYVVASSEDEFIEILRKILGSQKTKHVIQAILAQSTSLQPE
jgi:hypothetical protein